MRPAECQERPDERDDPELHPARKQLFGLRHRIDDGAEGPIQVDDDLRKAMPDAVRAKVEPDKPKIEAAPVVTVTPSMSDGMDALMRQTGFGQPSAPSLR